METDQVVVNHNTKVSLKLPPLWKADLVISPAPDYNRVLLYDYSSQLQKRCERVIEMVDFLEKLGFRISTGQNCVFADSADIEAGEVKKRLIEAGFRDREFQIVLEYTRKWGML